MSASFESDTYPYERVQGGYNTLKGAEDIPHKLLTYLLDLPDANGYTPTDDNSRARVRFIKYVYYDEPNPLSKPLPTTEEKLSILYNGFNPMLTTLEDKEKHPKGYRLMGQICAEPGEITARTLVKCYMGREIPRMDTKTILGVNFEVFVHSLFFFLP